MFASRNVFKYETANSFALNVVAPLFVFQWLFDEAQMEAENVGTPVTKQQWEYIHTMGEILRNSFHNVTWVSVLQRCAMWFATRISFHRRPFYYGDFNSRSVFAPSCISHSILSRKDWHYIRIDDISLPEALHCWERHTKTKFSKIMGRYRLPVISIIGTFFVQTSACIFLSTIDVFYADETFYLISRTTLAKLPDKWAKLNIQRKRLLRRRRCPNSAERREEGRNNEKLPKNTKVSSLIYNFIWESSLMTRRIVRSMQWLIFSISERNLLKSGVRRSMACSYRLIERCSWPQCNHYCPKLQNPLTGK